MTFSEPSAQYPSSLATDSDVGLQTNVESLTLNGAITASSTSFVVNEATADVPSVGIVTIGTERILYTSKNDGTKTFSGLTRGFDGSNAASHSDGAEVKWHHVAHHINALVKEVVAVEAELGTDPAVGMADVKTRLDAPNLTEDTTPDGAADLVITYDDSASTYKKVLLDNLPGGGGGGSAIILDLGDDGTNESTDLAEIATVNDTNSIFTEPSADKLLIDMSQNWPTADDSTQLGGVAAASYLRSDASDTYSGTTLTVTGTIDASGGGLVFPTALTPAPTVEGSAVWDTDDDVLRVGDGVGTVVLEPLGNLVRADIDALGTGSVVYTTETQTLTGKTVDLANNTVTGTAAEFNAAVSDDTFAFTSDTLAVFAATTSAQLAGVISDETGSGLLVFGSSPTIDAANLTGTITGSPTLSGTWTWNGNLVLPTAVAPGQTVEGSIVWDSDDDLLTVGDGTARKTMVDLTTAQTLTNKTIDAANNTLSNIGAVEVDLTDTYAWTGTQNVSGGTFVFPTATNPTPTTEGQVVWDSDDDVLRIGDGTGTVTLNPSAGGSAITLDLGDDGANESTDLTEIATTNDTNGIFTEPSADKLLIDVSQNWPTADNSTQLGGVAAANYLRSDTSDTFSGSTLTLDTGAGTNAALTEGGVDVSSTGAETFTIQNSGAGTMELRVSDTLSLDGGTTTIGSTELNLLDGMTGKTGADLSFVTGTAGTSGNISQWNVDGDLVDAGIAASDVALQSNDLSQFAATTSAQLAGVISDETGSGLLVFGTSPTVGGTVTFTNAGAGADPTISSNDAGQVLTVTGTLDATALTEGGNAVPNATDDLSFFSATTSAQLAGVISDETGSGALVFGTAPTLGGTPTIEETTDGASVQTLIVEGNRATPAANDEAYVTLRLSDSAGTQTEFARLTWVATDETDTTEDGQVRLSAVSAGSLGEVFRVDDAGISLDDGTTTISASELNLLDGKTNLVDATGTPADNQVAVWTDADTVEGDANLTWDGASLLVGSTVLDVDTSNTRVHLGVPSADPGSGAMSAAQLVFWLDEVNDQIEARALESDGATNITVTLGTGGGGSPGGSDTHVQFNDGGSFGGSANLTWDDNTLFVENEADVASAQVLTLSGNRATVADNDEGFVALQLSDGGGTQTEFARLTWVATDVTDTTEDGQLRFSAMVAGTLSEVFRVDDAGVSLDDGTTTVSSAELNLLDGMTAKTGADTSFATGTAGTSGNLAEWNADGDLVDSGNATSDFGPVGASYVVIALDGTLTSERVLTAGTNLSLTDGGAGGNATLDVDDAFVLNTGDTITGALVVDTAAGTNTSIDETGIDRSSTGVETFNVQNSGAGSLTLQEDGTDVAVVTDTLDVFAATTSAELASVISDETGSGALVFGTNPTVDFSGGTFTFPTATAPTPTTEGQAVWDSDDDVLRIGDGVGTVTLDPSSGAPTNAEYVVMSLNGSLSDERVLTAGTNLTLTDGGANGNATLDVDDAFVLNTGDTITGALTFDTAAGTNAAVDEAGIDRSSGSAETFNVQNSGAGEMTLQQDGTAVVVETRALTAGAGLTGGGDLSADRTFDVGAGTGITVNANDVAVDTSSTFSWSSSHTFNDVTQFNASIKISDLDQVSFGAGANYIFVYDSADNRFELRGGDIDGGGGNGDIFRVDDAQQGITFLGSVTVANSTLSLDNGGTVIAAAELNLLDGMTAKTGLDTVFVTGTAGTAGNLAEWNSDGDAVDAGLSIADVTTRSLTPGGATLPDTAFPELIKVSGGTGDFEWYELRYDDSTDENAYWTFHAPSATDATITIFWKAAATTGDVVWSVGHRSVTAGDAWDAADTDVTVTDTVEGTAEDTGIASTTLTTPFGAGEQVQLRVGRDADAAGDDMTGDAKLVGIKVTFA